MKLTELLESFAPVDDEAQESRYSGNIGIMELIKFFKEYPEYKQTYLDIKQKDGNTAALKYALEKMNLSLMGEPYIQENYIDSIIEGVHDPAIFKVIFIIGGPGSGKSYIANKLGLSALGYVNINSDIPFEYLMKKNVLNPKMPPEEKEKRDIVRQRSKNITASKSILAVDGRLGLVIDGTGSDYEQMINLKRNFDILGYNNFLVVVNTKLDIARNRNQKRARTVPDEIVVQRWSAVQSNIGKYAQVFENIAIIDNNGDQRSTDNQISNAYNQIVKFTKQPPNKITAKKWIAQQRLSVGENFADGRNPQDKGDSKRYGVPTKANISTLRKVAKQGGRKGQLAHWMANMKSGKAKAKRK